MLSLSAIVAVVALAHGPKHAKRLAAAHVRRGPMPSAAARLTAIETAGDANIRRLIPLGLPVYCGGPHGNEVAFTFDDGPGVYTHFAVKKLTEAHERATFFVVGRSMDGWPGWLPKELNLGAIGDHTYTHPLLTALSPAAITSEIERTRQRIEATIGEPIYLFRPPYGARGPSVDDIARQLALLEVMWSVDSRDSLGADWLGIIHNVEAGLYPGAIILMHENRGQTIRALTTLLPELKRRHLRSVSLPELFATDPPSVAQVRAGGAGCAGPARSALTGG
jgi:peptidoglycan/xylan/chitin deacetylase (PgdA/CDA1 family)